MAPSVPGKQQRLLLVERNEGPNDLISISIFIIINQSPSRVILFPALVMCSPYLNKDALPDSPNSHHPSPHPPQLSPPVDSGWWLAAYLKWQKLLWFKELSASFLLLNKSLWLQKCSFLSYFLKSMIYMHLFQVLRITILWLLLWQ